MRTTTSHTDNMALLSRDSVLTALGIGFLSSWVYCAYNTSSLFHGRPGNASLAHPSWLAAIAGAILVLVAGAVLFNRVRETRRLLEPAAVALMAGGTVLSAVSLAPLLSMAGGFASGIGYGLLWLFWGSVLAEIHSEQTEYIVPASSAVTALTALVFPTLSGPIGVTAVAALAPLSFGCLAVARKQVPYDGDPTRGNDARAPMPSRNILRVIAYTAGLYFVIGCLNSLSPLLETPLGPFTVNIPVFLGSCLGILLALLCILHAVRIDLASLSKLIAPLLMGAITLFALQRPLAERCFVALLAGADFMAVSVIIVYLVNLEKAGRLRRYSGIGIAQGAILIGSVAGNLFGRQWHGGLGLSTEQLLFIVLVLASALVLSLSFIPRSTSARPAAGPAASTQQERDIAEVVQDLAAAKGLTPRETEILEYLARGRTEPYIREQLWLSRSTVSTHVKHIYQKLGIHSKQEIISLIEKS